MSNIKPTEAYVYQPEPAKHPTPFAVAGPGAYHLRGERFATRGAAQMKADSINKDPLLNLICDAIKDHPHA